MNFGEKVKQLRAERNLTQPQLAQAIGIEQSYLSKLENDKSVPSADIFQAILRAFSIDVATLLEGIDDKIVHRDLKQVPEVANYLNGQVNRKVHRIKAWLFASATTCALGLTLVVAGQRGLLFPNTRYVYESDGVLLTGEPTNYFDVQMGLLNNKRAGGMISGEELSQKVDEFTRRVQQQVRSLDVYRGEAFIEPAPVGKRRFKLARITETERPQNRWLMFCGALLTFGGIFGFIVEQRLRSVRL